MHSTVNQQYLWNALLYLDGILTQMDNQPVIILASKNLTNV